MDGVADTAPQSAERPPAPRPQKRAARSPRHPAHAGRVVIVSNRVMPISSSAATPGGLATAMRAALGSEPAMWFGWSGDVVDGEPAPPRLSEEGFLTRALTDLNHNDYRRYYLGFSNRALWPLFHYRVTLSEFSHDDYAGYLRVNEQFAAQLLPLLHPDDLVWVHDYHLIPLGGLLRAKGAKQRLGFYLHTPFPGPETLTTLPVHREIIQALSAYDLVGFQTPRDVTAFTDYIERECGGQVAGDGHVSALGREFEVGAFPIGVDPDMIATRSRRAFHAPRSRRLRDSLAGRKLVIGVDRLDYTKGLLNRFKAVELMLEEHPEHRRGVVVLQIAPPTRGDVPEYRELRASLDGLMGHINGRFGDPDVLPVRYLNRHFSQTTLFGFYRASAVALVTPLRDGMNLVALEYAASQNPDDPGVLVLSRFAGAAQYLDGAVIINPYDPPALAAALDRALAMPMEERLERHRAMMQVIRRQDIKAWWNGFFSRLKGMGHARRRHAAALDYGFGAGQS